MLLEFGIVFDWPAWLMQRAPHERLAGRRALWDHLGGAMWVLPTAVGIQRTIGEAFVPRLAVSGSLTLGLASLGVLIYFTHHLAHSLQIDTIMSQIERETRLILDDFYSDQVGYLEPEERRWPGRGPGRPIGPGPSSTRGNFGGARCCVNIGGEQTMVPDVSFGLQG